MELITICFLPASQNKSIYQRLGSSGLDYSPAVSRPLSLSSNALIDFTRQPPGDYHLASYPACNCTVSTNAELQSKWSLEERATTSPPSAALALNPQAGGWKSLTPQKSRAQMTIGDNVGTLSEGRCWTIQLLNCSLCWINQTNQICI